MSDDEKNMTFDEVADLFAPESDDNIIQFPTPGATGYDGLMCECGSAWFDGSVVVDREGHVFGYRQPLHCRSCGKDAPQ